MDYYFFVCKHIFPLKSFFQIILLIKNNKQYYFIIVIYRTYHTKRLNNILINRFQNREVSPKGQSIVYNTREYYYLLL